MQVASYLSDTKELFSEDGCCKELPQRRECFSVRTQRRVVDNKSPRNLGCNLG